MLTYVIWWSGVLLELILLLRAVRGKFLQRFPGFYAYLCFVFLQTVLLFFVYRWAPENYARIYWICEYTDLALGSAILFDIYRVALRPFPGTARVARNLLGFVLALAVAKVFVNHSYGALWWPARTFEELERNLRIVQAFAILALLLAMLFYAVPRDRHLKGLIAGYALLVTTSILELSVLSYSGSSFVRVFHYLEPLAYLLVLGTWTAALWAPVRARQPAAALTGHASVVSRTRRELQDIALSLRGVTRR
jgi:hypothetical protein